MGDARECFIMTHGSKVRSSKSGHILPSAIMCSCESISMTFLMEYLATVKYPILPLTSVHDGMILATPDCIPQEFLESMNIEFKSFLEKKINLPVPIEFVTLGVPCSVES